MFLSEEQYLHAKDLFEQKTEPSPLLADLSSWAIEKYGIEVIDYICDERWDGKLRMMPVLWEDEEVDMFRRFRNYNPKIQKAFAFKFAKLCRKYKQHAGFTKPTEVFVAYETLKEEFEKRNIVINRVIKSCEPEKGEDEEAMEEPPEEVLRELPQKA